MTNHMTKHRQNFGDVKGGQIVHYDEVFDEYYFPLRGSVAQCLEFCPFCGEKLPESQRERWFTQIKALGLNPMEDANYKKKLPDAFRSAAWRLKQN